MFSRLPSLPSLSLSKKSPLVLPSLALLIALTFVGCSKTGTPISPTTQPALPSVESSGSPLTQEAPPKSSSGSTKQAGNPQTKQKHTSKPNKRGKDSPQKRMKKGSEASSPRAGKSQKRTS